MFTSGRRTRGVSIIYMVLILGILMGIASLAVDLGRVQVAKTQLRSSADAAARYAAKKLPNGVSSVQAAAIDAANDNTADGTTVTIVNSDVEFGTWSTSNRTFTVLSGAARSTANSVRITTRRTAATGNAIPLTFARMIGKSTQNITAQSTVMYVAPVNVSINVPATSCPWLAGMPDGSVANAINPHDNPDYAPAACPKQMTGLPLVAGQSLNFDSINGGAGNTPEMSHFTPDGNPNDIQGNYTGADNGLGNMVCPLNAVVGVFLNDNVPTSTATPSTLDFSTPDSRNFNSLSPQLKQVFFIGDGLMSDGTTKQSFVVPNGATRLFIGTMDGYEWNNNNGSFTTTITRPEQIQMVK